MSRKIFKGIWIVALSVFLASLVFIMGITYSYFSSLQKHQLKNETELASQGVEKAGESYFENLNAEGYRITWIGADGTVLFDSEANPTTMENHLEREEVKQALNEGYGESTRYSSTLSDKQLYAAKRLPDGSVLRLSMMQLAVWTLILGFAQPICIVIMIALVLTFVLASRLAKLIVKPINEIDLEKPDQYFGKENYQEIEPLLRHIAAQRNQLKLDQAQIEKTAMIRQEFTANASHELKTPLHAISGYAELLENGMVKEEDIKPFAAKIRGEASRMTKLVEDIIDLAELDSGGTELQWENCDLYCIAENAVDSLDTAASALNITLALEGTNAPLWGVPQILYSIVYNLCDNAIKYNHAGGSVTIGVFPSKHETKLSVKDTGIGIPAENRERVFERFFRVDKSRSKEVGGTGLGLALSRRLVKAMGGELKVKSELGKGSTFEIAIPDVQSTVLLETSAPAASGKVPAAPSRPVQRILLVDDSKMNLMVLKALLKKAGDYETTMAMLVVSVCPLIAHFFSLSGSLLTTIFFLLTLLLTAAMSVLNLWTTSFSIS
jgi:two-component system phosphate regulon sensor histidine kinase PhoR